LATLRKSQGDFSRYSSVKFSVPTDRSALSLWITRAHRSSGLVSPDSRNDIKTNLAAKLRRPFSWINSRMFVQRLKDLSDRETAADEPVLDAFAEVQQRWHLWRRRYDLFIRQGPRRILSLVSDPQPEPEPESYHQMAKIDEPFLAWDFVLRGAQGKELASVSRAFRGFGREVCREASHLIRKLICVALHRYRYGAPWFSRGVGSPTRCPGQYTIRFSPAERQVIVDGMVHVTREEGRVTSLDERAVSHRSTRSQRLMEPYIHSS